MASLSAMRSRPNYRRLLQAQAGVVIVVTLLGLGVGGQKVAMSAATGGLVCLLPNLFFVWRLGLLGNRRQASRFVSSFYRAEAGKLGLTVALFALVFVSVPPSNLAFFFGAYVAVHFMHWLAPWLLRG
ncbi:ATP synthase subunit I [Halomonas daqiaonensis]|uniref:ATP synthase protein I n=1 Tax=Halomonas daqiaonensis TaxID=650850 RepID=A0A1H7NRV9_9GAMM|nr:ATP synthase subunit I [Halomonas daqiaonensis]SEL26146.1 ATP synthase protein I [Halomonas daqiaonensis]